MAVIIERNFTGWFEGADRGISLRNEEYIRPLNIGNNWTKLRIAILVGAGNSANITAVLDIGMCSASGRGIGSGNPVNYVGGGMGGTVGGRLAAPFFDHVVYTGGWMGSAGVLYYTSMAGAVTTGYTISPGSYYIGSTLANAGVYSRMMSVVDIEKVSSVLCNVRHYSAPVAQVPYDVSDVSLVQACENPFGSSSASLTTIFAYNRNTASLSTVSYNTDGLKSIAWQESAGPLDAVNIAWSSSTAECTIWGMAVAKYA